MCCHVHLLAQRWMKREPFRRTYTCNGLNTSSLFLATLQMAAHAQVHAVLQVCGIGNAAQRNLLIQNEGFQTLADIAVMEEDADVAEMAKRSASRAAQDGRVILGTVVIKRLQGLVWWLHDRIKHQQPLDAAAFTPAIMAEAMTKSMLKSRLVSRLLLSRTWASFTQMNSTHRRTHF